MSISEFFDFLRALDSELYYVVEKFGVYIYLLLFLIVFGKTGLVILTFLPGDSLVFASGTVAAVDRLNFFLLFFIFFGATLLADSNNYLIGRTIQKFPRFNQHLHKFVSNSTIEKAQHFLEEYDRVAITFSRFIPLMRTMTPFIAGFTGYSYYQFVRFNGIGAFFWTTVWLGAGYGLGNIPWIKNNLFFTLTTITIILILPSAYGFLSQYRKKNPALDEKRS